MIGLITPYKTPNFGTKLQAYAMQTLLNKYDSTEIINFNTKSDYRLVSILGKISPNIVNSKINNLKNKKKSSPEFRRINNIRNNSIQSFDEEYFVFSKYYSKLSDMKRGIRKYDFVVCGSDQLWSLRNIDANWFNLSIVPKNIRKISFSASFGIEKIPTIYKPKYKKFLNRMDYISVREDTGKSIVEEMTKKSATLTLDPTLMLDPVEWNQVADKSKYNYNEKYIFCYFLGNNEKHRNFAKRLAKKTGYKLITMPHFKKWNNYEENFGDIQLYDVTPSDFVGLIKNAKYICTDSFHGTVFSIIYEKNVAVFERYSKDDKQSTNSRIYSLLNTLGLKDRLINNTSVDEFIKNKTDFKKVKEKLEKEKRKSYNYLDVALSIKD